FLRLPARLAGEGVVLRDAAVVAQPDHRARMVIRSLRALHLPALAEREIQIAGAVEDDAAAEVDAARAFRALPEQHLHFLQLPALYDGRHVEGVFLGPERGRAPRLRD